MALGAIFSVAEVIPLTFLTLEAWTVGFWNFVGAGIFGFLINLSTVSYYEIGTALTANHAHASMMGVYGMLAAGLSLFGLRYLLPEERWSERAARLSFWSLNLGLGYEARELAFLTSSTNRWLGVRYRRPGAVATSAHAGALFTESKPLEPEESR